MRTTQGIQKKIVIIGAGDHGRGVLEILKARNQLVDQFELVGFVDDDRSKAGSYIEGIPVLGDLKWIAKNRRQDLDFVIGIAGCKCKERIVRQLAPYRLKYLTMVHPAATLGSGVELGAGNVIAAGVVIAYNTKLGDHVTVNLNATIGHDCQIGDFATVAPGANVAGHVQIGEGCDIGLNATVIRSLTLGHWSSLGPGTVALRNVPSGQSFFGNPARAIQLDFLRTA